MQTPSLKIPQDLAAVTEEHPARPRSLAAGRLKRRWTINGDFVGLKPTGVARYASELTLAIDALVGENHALAADLDLRVVAPRPYALANIPVRVVPEFRRPRLPQIWVQLQLPYFVDGGLMSFCNLAPIAVRRQIACIHDLHTYLMPESFSRGFILAHKVILPIIGKRAALITTVSQHSRGDLEKFGVADGSKVAVTYNGADHAHRWNSAASGLDLSGQRAFVLCLGRSQKYKNMELIWQIAPALDAAGIDICMAGDFSAEEFLALRGDDAIPSNIRFFGRVSDDEFAHLLSEAICFVFPSRIEGFGLPAVEAMVRGCALVVSTAPCLPEVCGDAALQASPDKPEDWVAAIKRIRDDGSLKQDLKEKGFRQAQRYSWRQIALNYLELTKRVDCNFGSTFVG